MDSAEESAVQALPQPQLHGGHVYGAQMHAPVCDSTQLWLQQQQQQRAVAHPHLTVSETQMFSPMMSITGPVWRPWP